MNQPKPKKNKNKPICDMVIKDLKARKALGLKKYGTFLQANNGRSALQDLYEELLDAAQYIKQAIEEEKKEPTVCDVRRCDNPYCHRC